MYVHTLIEETFGAYCKYEFNLLKMNPITFQWECNVYIGSVQLMLHISRLEIISWHHLLLSMWPYIICNSFGAPFIITLSTLPPLPVSPLHSLPLFFSSPTFSYPFLPSLSLSIPPIPSLPILFHHFPSSLLYFSPVLPFLFSPSPFLSPFPIPSPPYSLFSLASPNTCCVDMLKYTFFYHLFFLIIKRTSCIFALIVGSF